LAQATNSSYSRILKSVTMVALVAKQMEQFPSEDSFATDTLHLEFPSQASHAAILETLAQFGEVMTLDLIPAPPGLQLKTIVVSVVYFDVRAVQCAVDTLGCQRCTLMPQSVSHTVLMAGSVQLDAQGIQGVSSVITDPSDKGSFLVEFFDSRDAERARAAAYYACLSEVPMEDEMHPSQETELCAPQFHVSIKGLPNGICTKPMMEAVLEQAGLEDAVVSSEVQTGTRCGHCILVLNGQQAVDKCIAHFSGRKWDVSGAVVVSVESQRAHQQVDRTASVSAAVAPSLCCSEEATDCGGSDDDLEHFHAPPGLERSSMQARPQRWAKPQKACSSRVTASTCSSEPHSDVEAEDLSVQLIS